MWKSQYCCFTLNNYTQTNITRLQSLTNHSCPLRYKNKVQYIIFQEEVAPSTHTPHLQGYVEFSTRLRMDLIKELLTGDPHSGIHLEKRSGTAIQAKEYCKKTDSRKPNTLPFESGTLLITTRIEEENNFISDIKDLTTPFNDIIDDHTITYLKIGSRAKEIRELQYKHRDKIPEIYIFTGPSGSGKSFTARKYWPNAYTVPWPTGGRWWWPNYNHEDCIILDEFRQQIAYHVLLQLLDSGPFTIEHKGGNQKMTSNTIIITSNIPLAEWYKGVKQRTALFRRIQQFATIMEFDFEEGIEHFNSDLTPNSVITIFHMEQYHIDRFASTYEPATRQQDDQTRTGLTNNISINE